MECHEICEKYGYVAPIVEQSAYNLLMREKIEVEYGPLYDKYGMGLTIHTPLCAGILTGKYNDGNIPEDSRVGASGPFQALYAGNLNKMMGPNNELTTKLQALGSLAEELQCT